VTRRPVPRELLAGAAPQVAPLLLNAILQVGGRAGRIVEVEAYGGDPTSGDPASHAHRGPTVSNASMFARAGTLYCYRSYGIHTCANVVTGTQGDGQAVLLRALTPLDDVAGMWACRPAARREVDLANGPGKLCEALGITLDHDGVDLCDGSSPVRLLTDGTAAPSLVRRDPRVGITKAADRLLRFRV